MTAKEKNGPPNGPREWVPPVSSRVRLERLDRGGSRPKGRSTYALSPEDYERLHDDLAAVGLESELKWETLSNPAHLRTLIEMRREGKSPAEAAWEIRKL